MGSELKPLTIAQYRALVLREQTQSDRRIAKLKDRLRLFQRYCTHVNTRYNPDPSGNNDSSTECLECGLEAKHLPIAAR